MDHYHIAWTDDLSIGNELIDNQHQKLIQRIASVPEHDDTADTDLFQQTLAYAQTHFNDEEALMSSINYPKLSEHQKEHKRLVRTLMAYYKEYEAGQHDAYSFKQFLFRWVRDHIMDSDHQIGQFMRQTD